MMDRIYEFANSQILDRQKDSQTDRQGQMKSCLSTKKQRFLVLFFSGYQGYKKTTVYVLNSVWYCGYTIQYTMGARYACG